MRWTVPGLALLLAGCGYVGDPRPPLANIPGRITDLAAVQRGDRIIVQFTVPAFTTEAIAVKTLPHLDLRISGAISPFSEAAWAGAAKPVAPAPVKNGFAHYEIPSTAWAAHDVTIAARAIGDNGKEGAWSNFVSLPVVAPPERPAAVKAEATATGVRLSWTGSPGEFRVLRRAGDEKSFSVTAALVKASEYLDTTTEFGKPYRYLVQRMVPLGNGRQAESELSEEAAITPADTFEPAAPTGLHALAAPSSVELSWEPNTEPDLAGYRIYRSDGGTFEKLADLSAVPAYSDRKVEAGKTYRYVITAVDRSGNESARSTPVEASM